MDKSIIKDEQNRNLSVGPTTMKDLACPYCTANLAFVQITVETFPYTHADLVLYCIYCKKKFLFGIPFDPIAGMSKMVFAESVTEASLAFLDTAPPICPFHRKPMKPTKYFSSPIADNPKLQFKCPECFYIRHLPVDLSIEKNSRKEGDNEHS